MENARHSGDDHLVEEILNSWSIFVVEVEGFQNNCLFFYHPDSVGS
jgi:hypothetical protein